MSVRYLPAGYEDDEEDDYDDDYDDSYNGYCDDAEKNGTDNSVERSEPWSHPKTLKHNLDQTKRIRVWDTLSFVSLIRANDVNGVKECLEQDKTFANVNLTSTMTLAEGGSRPIFVACHHALPDMVSLLIKFGAHLGAETYDLLTPLMSVCASADLGTDVAEFESRLVQCAKILIEDGKADVNARQSQKMTALMFAAKQGHDLVADLLIQKGANLNDFESQRWTALTFAVDADQGHVVRRLLEAGADPDIVTLDGSLPIDLAHARNNTQMANVIKAFARRDKIQLEDNLQITKYTELDNILLGSDAAEYIPLFSRHKIDLETFLTLNEQDLEEIGVDKIGVRKKLFQAIIGIHRKDWQKSSLPKLSPKDQKNGIYLSCPDAIIQMANVSQHFKFLSANLQFLKRHLTEKPEMLLIGKDVADATDLAKHVSLARQNLNLASNHLNSVEVALKTASTKLGVEIVPADMIANQSGSRRKKRVILFSAIAISSAVGIGLVIVATKLIAKN